MANSILTAHKSCNLTPPMCKTQHIGIWSDRVPSMTDISPLGQPTPLKGAAPRGGFGIDTGLDVVNRRVPAASRSHPQIPASQ